MTKKNLSVIIALIVVMMLSSCTAEGVECGLIGKWESLRYYEGEQTVEITADDKITFTSSQDSGFNKETRKGTIEHVVVGKAIIYKIDGSDEESVLEYSDLSGNTVRFYNLTYHRVR